MCAKPILDGKKIVVTGASRGIGKAMAKAVVEAGASVVLIARGEEALNQTQAELQKIAASERAINIITFDLMKINNFAELVAQLPASFESLDCLINNAGISRFSPFEDVSIEEFDRLFNLNFKAPYFLTQALLPNLKSTRGSVINVSSYFAHKGIPNLPSSVYSSTKGAINSLTIRLAAELGLQGIRVNAIAPGTVETPMVKKNLEQLPSDSSKAMKEYYDKFYPFGRLGKPEDYGGVAVFLTSDAAKWISGAIVPVDGAYTTL